MRCSELLTWASAPSAVWASEMPSLELRIATFMPRTCEFMRSAIDRPAASSFDELMRRPEDRRCIDVASDICEPDRLRCASMELMLVLIERVMIHSWGDKIRRDCRVFRPKVENGWGRELLFGTPIARLEDFLISSLRDRRDGVVHPAPRRTDVPANCTVTGPVIGTIAPGLHPRLARS